MNTDETKQNIKDEILQKIQKGELKMRPKAFFVVKVAILVFVAFITFVISVLLVSYTWFILRAGGQIFLLSFGSRGLFQFFLVFPWLLLLLDVLLIVFLDWLIKRFRFGYHNPVLYVFIGSLVLITLGGTIVNMTSFHKSIMYMSENKHMPVPIVSIFYNSLRKTHKEKGLFRGEIVSLATSSFMIRSGKLDMDESTATVQVISNTGENFNLILQIGDEVFIAGDVKNGEIYAYGVKKLTDDQ